MRPANALQLRASSRIVWLDQLKGAAFFFVILGHLSVPGALKTWIYSFHMPVFFFATGCTYNIEKLKNTSAKTYLGKLCRRMLVPYVWMQLLCIPTRYVITSLIKHKPTPVKEYLYGIFVGDGSLVKMPSTPLYFLLLLFLAEALLFLLVKLTRGNRFWMLVFCTALLPFSLLTQGVHAPWRINVVPAAAMMVLLGNLLMALYRRYQTVLETAAPVTVWAAAISLLCLGALIAKFNGRFGLFGNTYGKDFLCAMLAAVCSSVGFALLVMRLPQTRLLTFVGKHTLFYMGVHKPVLLLLETLFKRYQTNLAFIFCAAVVCYFLLVPVTLACEKLAPFVLGKETPRAGLLPRVGELLCVIGSTCVPYLYFLNGFHDGLLRSTAGYTVLSVALYVLAVAAIWAFCRRVLRFPFLPPTKTEAA